MSQRILVFGATSAIAQVAIKEWAARKCSLFLVARDAGKLKAVAQDAKVRGAEVKTAEADAGDDLASLKKLVAKAWGAWDGLDGAFIAHGQLPDQAKVQDDPAAVAKVIAVNGGSVIALLTLLAPHFEAQKHGWMAGISSVAGDRGRAKMYVYGTAKAMVSHYLEGLRQRLNGAGVRVIDIRPGPVDTPMTKGLRMPLMADVESVGKGVVAACDRANGTVYLPWFWRFIMTGLTHVPMALWVKMKI